MSAVSSIYRRGQRPEPVPMDPAEFHEGCRRAWHEKRIIVLHPDDWTQQLPAGARMAVEALAIGKWGKRKGEANG